MWASSSSCSSTGLHHRPQTQSFVQVYVREESLLWSVQHMHCYDMAVVCFSREHRLHAAWHRRPRGMAGYGCGEHGRLCASTSAFCAWAFRLRSFALYGGAPPPAGIKYPTLSRNLSFTCDDTLITNDHRQPRLRCARRRPVHSYPHLDGRDARVTAAIVSEDTARSRRPWRQQGHPGGGPTDARDTCELKVRLRVASGATLSGTTPACS